MSWVLVGWAAHHSSARSSVHPVAQRQAAAFLEQGLFPATTLLLLSGAVVACLGFADDISTVRPSVRFAVEVVAALAVAFGGVALTVFDPTRVPIVGTHGIAGMVIFASFVVFFVVGAINAVNMQDGLDGLAGGVAAVSCIGFFAVGSWSGQSIIAVAALSLGAALAGFLVFNFNPASVFMGDNGSYFVGLVIAGLGLLVLFKQGSLAGLAGGVLLVGLPVFDAAFAVVRRVAKGVSPFEGDRSHFYDLLCQRGLGTRAVALTCYALQAVFVAAGVALLLS